MKPSYSNQHGRSMIEMLGILAIIGILSIGGISQFNKAMTKYKLNQALEQYALIFSLISTDMDKWLRNKTDSFCSLTNLWKQMSAVPQTMIEQPQGEFLSDILGNKFYVRRYAPYIEMDIFLKKGTDIRGLCTSLYQHFLIPRHNELRSIFLHLDNKHMYPFYGACRYEQQCITDMTMTDILTICDDCHQGNSCKIVIIWNI